VPANRQRRERQDDADEAAPDGRAGWETLVMASGWYLAIEGATGAGKTTLAKRLAPALNAVLFLDPFERNPFLTQLDRGCADSWLAAELAFLGLRIAQLRQIEAKLRAGAVVVTDWALAKTRVFPRTTLAPADADHVEAACSLWQPTLSVPDLTLHLRAGPDVLAARIARRGRAFERTITAAELAQQAVLLEVALTGLPAMPLDADAFNVFDDASVATLAAEITSVRRSPGRT
jgi:deoxyguanosine kinase